MRIVSINANKKLFTDRNQQAFLHWLAALDCDLLTVQEPWHKPPSEGPELPGLHFIGGSDDVVFWCRIGHEIGLYQTQEHWVSLPFGDYEVHSVHLNPNSSKLRREQIDELCANVGRDGLPVVIVGDFNIAPRPEDGIYGDKFSTWNTKVERKAFSSLVSSHHLTDATAADGDGLEFTIERMYRKRWARFRCDLALIPAYLDPNRTRVEYDHSVRTGSHAFTDHSAIILDIPDDPGATIRPLQVDKIDLPAASASVAAINVDEVRSENTAIARKGPSVLARAISEHDLFEDFHRILDYGCGRGRDVEFYRELGKDADGWDPHAQFGWLDAPEGRYDLVTIVYVVHVLPTVEQRLQVLRSAAMYGDRVIVAVRSRSEIERQAQKGDWEEISDGYMSSETRRTFQRGYTTEELEELIKMAGLEPVPFKLPRPTSAVYCMATMAP